MKALEKDPQDRSFIVWRDPGTLLVSQHIPSEASNIPSPEGSWVSLTQFNHRRDGSLLELFESPLFDIHKLIYYLHSINRRELLEYLVNKLYREYRDNVRLIDFYLPQLCYMCITKEVSLPLERFVLQMSIKYQIIGLKSLHLFAAWSEDKLPYAQKAEDLYNHTEGAIVNANLP